MLSTSLRESRRAIAFEVTPLPLRARRRRACKATAAVLALPLPPSSRLQLSGPSSQPLNYLHMLPTQQRLDEIASSTSGSFESVPFAALLTALATKKRTALIEMRRGPIEKKIILEAGIPVDCRSNLAHETLGRYMLALGKLREDEFQTALARSASLGVPLGQVLLEQELITSVELFKLLQQNLAKKLLDCFSWRSGDYSLTSEVPAFEATLKVKPAQLIVTGVLKSAQQEEVNAAVVSLISKKLGLNPDPPFPIEELRFSAAQNQIIEAIAKRSRIDELAAIGELGYDEIARFVYALSIIRLVLPEDQLPKGSAAPTLPIRKAEASMRSVEMPLPTAVSVDDEILRNDLMQAYLALRGRDAFDLLHLAEDANEQQIKQAYLDYAKKCAPWRFEGPVLGSLREKAEELFYAGAKAFAELASSEQRLTLIHRRRTLREEQKRSSYANRFAITTDLLDSELQYKKGAALLEQGKFRDALQYLEFASDCDPQNATYAAEVAWCKFRLSPQFATEAIKKLREAIRLDPESGVAVFYLGEIHRQSGQPAEAEPLLRKACKMMAPDRRPVEALKALMTGR